MAVAVRGLSTLRAVALSTAALAAAPPALAHHSRAPYDLTQEIVIEGTVAELDWKNPHIYVTIEVAGSDGATALQDVEGLSISEARALGLTPDALAPGSAVTVRARPGRRGPGARALGLTVTTSDGTVLPLNTDAGFGVAPPVAELAQGIAGRWAPSVAEFRAVRAAMNDWPYTEPDRAAVAADRNDPASMRGICTDYTFPLLSGFPDLREIVVGDAAVTMRFEAQGQNEERIVRLDETEHPADVVPSVLGHSIGRWEGETLVIDTVAFEPRPFGINRAVSSGPGKHVVERLSLAEDRLHLQYELTIEDPDHLTAPGSFSQLWDYRPDLEFSGEGCDPETARRFLEDAQ